MRIWDAEKNAIKREGALSFDAFVDAGAYILNEITSRLAALRRNPIDVWGYDEIGRVKVIGSIVSVIFPSDGAKFAVKPVRGEGTGLILSAEDLGKTWWLSEEDARNGSLAPAEKLYAMCRSEGCLLQDVRVTFGTGGRVVEIEAEKLVSHTDDQFYHYYQNWDSSGSSVAEKNLSLMRFLRESLGDHSYLYEIGPSDKVRHCLAITKDGKLYIVLDLDLMAVRDAEGVLK